MIPDQNEHPPGWMSVALGRVVRFANGFDYKDVEVSEGGYPVYGSGGVFRRASRYLYDGESVLFGRKGTIDRPLYVNERFWTVDTMYYTIPGPRVVPKFLYYVATTIPFGSYSTSTALPSMTQSDLAGHKIPLPPLHEQRAIADFLDHETVQIDALVAKQEEFVAYLRERRTAAIGEALAQLGPADTQLRRVAQIQTGITLSGDGDPSLPAWAYLRVANVQMGHVDLTEVKTIHLSQREASGSMLHAGDVLMTEGGDIDKLGRGTVWDGRISPMVHQNHVFAARANPARLMPEYLALWLDSTTAREYFYATAKKTTNLASTNKTVVGRLPMCVPSIERQASVVQQCSEESGRLDALIAKAQEHIALAKERRAALITAAVTGQLDVRTAQKVG